LLGLDSSLVRFLPDSKNQSKDINAAMLVVAGAAMLSAALYMIIGPHLGIQLVLLDDTWEKVSFVVLMAVVSLNSLTDSVFIANRRAGLHTMTYTIQAVVKLILPLFLIPFGSMGIFAAYAGGVLASLILTFFLMRRTSSYSIAKPNWKLLSAARKYAANNYIGHTLSSATAQLMPIFILTERNATEVAYFSMAWTMANFLYVIPTAIAQSLLAESATNTLKKIQHVKNAVRILAFILIPTVMVAVIGAPYLLTIFGSQYSAGSSAVFQILAIATFFVAINEVCITILNIEHRSSGVVAAQLSSLIVTFGSAIFLIRFGLIGVGGALLLGTIASNLSHLIFFTCKLGKRQKTTATTQPIGAAFVYNDTLHKNLQMLLRTYPIQDFEAKILASGGNSQTFLIRHDDITQVLRIYRKNKRTKEQIEQEIAFTQFLGECGVPVPTFVPSTNGQLLSEHRIKDTPRYYLLMEFEPGIHPSHYNKDLLLQMAQTQASIHIHGATFAQTQSRLHGSSIFDRVLRFLPKGFSHCDFDATNILVNNQKLTCVLDFEGIRQVPFVSCLFFTLTRIYDLQPSKKDLEFYVAAYQTSRKLTALEKFVIKAALAARYKKPQFLFLHV
jgi:Ser/Thr protein kinase RdoA (MazF antagonist)/O-antigen/teichoic acid export membrane protein